MGMTRVACLDSSPFPRGEAKPFTFDHYFPRTILMAKGQSSASSATRKKHARKSGKDTPAPELLPREKKLKGKDKGKNKEPKKKVYIAPAKPAPVQQDPLDTLGLAHQLPPELLVVLRKFSKKDAVTKTKALEELQAGWIDKAKKEEEGSYTSEILVLMLPVWVRPISMSFILRFIKCTSMY